jgi:hypothetical protein
VALTLLGVRNHSGRRRSAIEGRRSPEQEDDRSEAQPEGPPSSHRRLIADPDEPHAGRENESRSSQLQRDRVTMPPRVGAARSHTSSLHEKSGLYRDPSPSAKGLADRHPPAEKATPALTIMKPDIEARMAATYGWR